MDLREKGDHNEHRHPWEISRCKCLFSVIDKKNQSLQYADVGAGDMYLTEKMSKLSTYPIFAVDNKFISLVSNDKVIMFRNLTNVPKNSVDVLFLLDVLEHVEREDSFLSDVVAIMKSNSKILFTVPAHQFLFSPHDVFLKHFRRYSITSAEKILEKHGLSIVASFYFYTSLFIVRSLELLLYRIGIKREFAKTVSKWRFNEKSFISRMVVFVLNCDFKINILLQKENIKLPGLSIGVLCIKK
jgi:hypothetical protein